MKKRTGIMLPAAVFAACVLLAGCGCGKEKDPAEQQVLKITVTPEPTATPVPEEVNPDAVVTSGGVTMVNEYLIQKGGTASGENSVSQTDGAAGEGENSEDGEDESYADGE